MNKISVLLTCGAGASSGFMAANLRKAAKNRGVELDAKARSESEIETYTSEVDCIMVGPHLTYLVDELKTRIGADGPKILLMKRDYYSALDGDEALDDLINCLGEEE